ncbi:MAG: ABC-F family ATP-binding cassette domain-containing protein [Desulfocucumaceae bacterium]
MLILQASAVSKSFGTRVVLDDVSIIVHAGEKAGLVGPNGEGKTTLLKILAGEIKPDTGEIIRPGGSTAGYLAQEEGLSSGSTVMEEMLSVFSPLIDQEEALRKLERLMGEQEALDNPLLLQQLSDQYSSLSEDFRNRGGYEYRANIRAVLNGLKFGEEYHSRIVDTLSGGQKTRLAMAGLLLARPDILILDEPTNHLDMETLSWLEKYLQSYSGSILVVSHDRYFLDSLVASVYELDRGKLKRYTGNYSKFVTLRAESREREGKLYEKQREEIARAEDFIRRNIARASTTGRAQSRKKALEKINVMEKPSDFKSASFSFSAERPSGREVVSAKNLIIGYGDHPLTGGLDLTIERGERIALIGPNGAGKSTFLKTVAGRLRPLKGHLLLGFNVETGYYDQEQSTLEGTRTVLDYLWNSFPFMDEKDIRGILGSFLFSGDDVFKTADKLSGGEKARLSLAGLMLKRSNFLLLDEPTNHLDVYSREVLEGALSDFQGTILFVSHDRYFLNKLATRVIEINPFGLTGFQGNYDNFLSRRDTVRDPVSPALDLEKEFARLSYRKDKEARRLQEKMARRVSKLEKVIEETEIIVATLEEEIYTPEVNKDFNLLMKKNADLEKYREELDSFYTEWESVTNELAAVDQIEK